MDKTERQQLNERVHGWQAKDLQRGWECGWVKIDARPARYGYEHPHDAYWYHTAPDKMWVPSTRQKCINREYDLREAYDMKLDACRKWWLKKIWRDWHKTCLLNKLLRRG